METGTECRVYIGCLILGFFFGLCSIQWVGYYGDRRVLHLRYQHITPCDLFIAKFSFIYYVSAAALGCLFSICG